MKRKILLASVTLGIVGCSTPALQHPAPNLTVLQQTELPRPETGDLLTPDRPYQIGPFDKLKIDVFGVSELDRAVQTDASGNFLYPLIGVINAGGATPAELAADIESKLRGRYVRNPHVTVNLVESKSQLVTIDGEVRRPGSYPVIGKMTLIKAIAAAEGTAQYASLKDVVIFRTVNDKRYAGLYNLAAIRDGVYDDPEIYANDVIVVGDSPGRRLFQDLLQASPLITTPLIILAQQR